MEDICLRSHDGADEVRLRLDEVFDGEGGKSQLKASCRMHGMAYDRLGSVLGKPITERNKQDYDTYLPQIVLDIGFLSQLAAALSKWQEDRQLFKVSISDANEQKMTFGLELLDDFICSSDRPVAVFRYSVHRLAIESRFVADCTTLGDFENSVNWTLKALSCGPKKGSHQEAQGLGQSCSE